MPHLWFGIFSFLILLVMTAWGLQNFVHAASAPAIITYQGKLLNAGISVDATTTMSFLIYTDPSAGSLLYTAAGTTGAPTTIEVPVTDGIFSVNLGGSGTNALDSSILADNATLYLEVEVEGTTLSPRKRLTSAPYALNSAYLMGYGAATASTTAYIPVSDGNGNFVFTGTPQSSAVDGGVIYVNPASADPDETLFGLAVGGGEKFRVDEDGDAWFAGGVSATGTATSSFTNIDVSDGITLGGVKQTSWPAGGGDVTAAGTNTFTATNTFTGFTNLQGKIAAPSVISNIPDFANNAENVFVQGNYAYIADGGGGLEIYDITKPSAPSNMSILDPHIYAYDVVVAGDYAYVADTGLSIIDISDPSQPREVFFVGNNAKTLALSGNYLYVGGDLGLYVYNISDPGHPVLADTSALDGNTVGGIALLGRYAYVTQGATGLSVVDISDPYNLTTIGSVDNGDAYRVVVSGRYAYVADNSANVVDVVDIGDPYFPNPVATISLDGGVSEVPERLFVAGDYLFIAAGAPDLAIFDISNPLSATRVGAAGGIVNGSAKGVFVSGNYIYLANNDEGTNVLDILGTKISSAQVGSLKVENIDTEGLAQFNKSVSIRGGLNVGNQGLLLHGDFSMFSTTSTLSSTNTLFFSNTTVFKTFVSTTDDHAFIFDTKNTIVNSAAKYLFSVRNNGIPTFSIATNGDVHTTGTYYGEAVAVSTPGTPGDLAERVDIALDEQVEPGDVVVVDSKTTDTYRRSSFAYAQEVSGVISTNPTITVGSGKTQHTAVMAMVGRVPIKVTTENGPIVRGDLLVTASTTGYAMRYDPTHNPTDHIAGVVGVALESLPLGTGKIMGLVRTGWVQGEYETLSEMKEQLRKLLLAGTASNGGDDLSVREDNTGSIVSIESDLNLNGFSLLSVKSIKGLNDKWQIDEEGRFITQVDTSIGKKTLYGLQSGEDQYVFSGNGQLENGVVRIDFDDTIKELVATNKAMSINLTLTQKAKGVYVSARDENGFEVEEVDGGTSDATFDWLIFATRKNASDVDAETEELGDAPIDEGSNSGGNEELENVDNGNVPEEIDVPSEDASSTPEGSPEEASTETPPPEEPAAEEVTPPPSEDVQAPIEESAPSDSAPTE